MTLTYYGDSVRVRTERSANPTGQDYEVVEIKIDSGWSECIRYGHQGDDYALTNARRMAQSLAAARVGRH